MNIYRLSVADENFPGWRYSTHKGIVFIRAESEARARSLADGAFLKYALIEFGQKTSHAPWRDAAAVDVALYDGDEFSILGEEEILSPER